MTSGDFFKTQMRTPLGGSFLIVSLICRLATNSETILEHVRKNFTTIASATAPPDVTVRFWVDDAAQSPLLSGKPRFRGVGGAVFASFDRGNFFLMNLMKRCVIGRFTQDFVEEESGLSRTVFPVMVAALGPANGISVIHGACVTDQRRALLLAGSSGSGKSTLSLSLCELGYACLSDDRTYISSRHGRLLCWGAGSRLKLRSEAVQHFPEIVMAKAVDGGGLETFEVDLARYLGSGHRRYAEPGWIVFLEPKEGAGFELSEISSSEAATRLEDGVMQDTPEAIARQLELIRKLAKRPSYLCRYSGPPRAVARALAEAFFSSGVVRTSPAPSKAAEVNRPSTAAYRDPLRRFTSLAHQFPVQMMGRSGMLATNSLRVSQVAQRFLESRISTTSEGAAFTWRIATEEDKCPRPPWPQPAGLAAEGMRCVNLGAAGFVAADFEAREITGFTSESRAADVAGFAGFFLAAMAHLTAAVLRITPVSSACITKQNRGLLLLGPPGCGKTTCAYEAQKLGFEIHSDMATFLELRGGRLHAWGEFWPALFRQETARFYPELLRSGQPLVHENETFISLEKNRLAPCEGNSIVPALVLVLERGKARIPRLAQLSRSKYAEILKASCPYAEESQNQTHKSAVLSELLSLPAYKLTFGEDPAEAAVFCRSLFTTYHSLEGLR